MTLFEKAKALTIPKIAIGISFVAFLVLQSMPSVFFFLISSGVFALELFLDNSPKAKETSNRLDTLEQQVTRILNRLGK